MYHKRIFDEIIQMIRDNLELIYAYNDDSLINIRKFSIQNDHSKYKPLPYNQLIFYLEEVISEIINAPYLYDFRSLE